MTAKLCGAGLSLSLMMLVACESTSFPPPDCVEVSCQESSSDAGAEPGTGGLASATGGQSTSDLSTGGAGAVSDTPNTGSGGSDSDASTGDPTENSGGTSDSPAGVGTVGQHGALQVSGNRVVDAQGTPIQLRGMSLFWSQWTDFYLADNVDVLVDDWQATLVRAVLGVENQGGYLEDPDTNVAKVRTIVDRAIERGIYVIIDWHDHTAEDHQQEATAFFAQMAELYGNDPHVIFEIYNEPIYTPWTTVKSYAESIISTIRGAGADNLIIVGSPTWSQDVDIAASDPITSADNIAYTLHFYANTHSQALRDKATTALNNGLALFVTEWGTCSADGNGTINETETLVWLAFLQDNGISWANWALNNKDEACSALIPSASSQGPWSDTELTASGQLVINEIP